MNFIGIAHIKQLYKYYLVWYYLESGEALWQSFDAVDMCLSPGKWDHDPKHVHVFRDGREVLKWNLEANVVMNGQITKKILDMIEQLVKEGKL